MSLTDHGATYSVAELCEEIKIFVGEAFPFLWVRGEVQRLHRSRSGHLYFELVEKGTGDALIGRLDSVIWRSDLERVDRELARAGVELGEGVEIRVRANLDLYPPQGRLQLAIREIDPTFLLGRVELLRRETTARLARAGLIDRNRSLELPDVPLKLAVVASVGSAGYQDFVTGLGDSGWAFDIALIDTVVQGQYAPDSIASGLATASAADVDAVVVVRGGGAKSDLHAFDTYPVATAVASCPHPVIVGLGHQIDLSVSDRVAHTSVKTPTQAASFLVERVNGAERRRAELAAALVAASDGLQTAAERQLARSGLRLRVASERVQAARRRLDGVGGRIASASQRRMVAAEVAVAKLSDRTPRTAQALLTGSLGHLRSVARGIAASAGNLTARLEVQLDGYQRLAAELAPDRLLARGYSVTRREGGGLVRSAADLNRGERIHTRLARGGFWAQIESTEESK